MPKQPSTNDFILDRLVNWTGSAEGSNLPPRQRGSFRVPIVSGLRVENVSYNGPKNIFTISWQEPEDPTINVSTYNIYARNLVQENSQPVLAVSSRRSPAKVELSSSETEAVTFYVQTVIANGLASPILASPTCTGNTASATPPTQATSSFNVVNVNNICDATAGNSVALLPDATKVAGAAYFFKKVDASANTITVSTVLSQVIDGGLTQVLSAQWQAITVLSNGVSWFIANSY